MNLQLNRKKFDPKCFSNKYLNDQYRKNDQFE
jgi:hypothetical protein